MSPVAGGVIILAGTVVNSSIVLIDYTLQRRERGEDKNTAILNACPRRVRPVLMTAMTTILGLVPMVFSNGEGSEMMKPMGIVMMTGMVISTVATLFITPVYYSLTDSIARAARAERAAAAARTRRKTRLLPNKPARLPLQKSVKYCMIGVSTPESGNGCVSAAVFPAFRQILREGRPQSMKRWPVAAAVLAACLTGCAGETTATVNPQTQALERAEQAGLLREEEKKPQLLSVYEAQKLAGEQFDSESYAVAPSRETLECEIEGETHSFAVFDVSRRADGGAVGQVAVDRVTGDRYSYPGEGVLGEYDALLSEPEDTETDWAGCYAASSGASVMLEQTGEGTFTFTFSDGVTGMASADRDSAASEDGEIRFLLHEDVLTVIGSGETGNYTLVEQPEEQ